jgi:predicted phage-related endonuclease
MSAERTIYDRRSTLGSSDVPKVLGISNPNFGDAWDVWAKKTGFVDEKSGDTFSQRRGNIIEPALLMWIGEEIGMAFTKGPTISDPPAIGPEPWMAARADGLGKVKRGRRIRALAEAKTVRRFGPEWGPDQSDIFPASHAAQCAWQMAVYDVNLVHLVAFATSSDEIRHYEVRRNRKFEKRMVNFLRGWWLRHVIGGEMPAVTASAACSSVLSMIIPQATEDEWRDASDEEASFLDDYIEAKRDRDDAEKRRLLAGNHLKSLMGETYGLRVGGEPAVIFHKHGKGRRLRILERE